MIGEDDYSYDTIEEMKTKDFDVASEGAWDEYFERVICPEIKAFDYVRDEDNVMNDEINYCVYITFHKLNKIIHMKKIVLFADKTWQELNITENGAFKYDVPVYN